MRSRHVFATSTWCIALAAVLGNLAFAQTTTPETYLELLRSDDASGDEELLDAAIHALPADPPAALVQDLVSMVRGGMEDEVELGLRALARTKPGADTEQKLTDLIDSLEPRAQLKFLDLLAGMETRLHDPRPVWAIAQNGGELRVRARAIYCLEQTRSFAAAELRDNLPGMDPLLRYFSARCLLQGGQGEGLVILLDLVDDDDSTESCVASRRLLAWLTGRSPGTSRDEFERSLAQLDPSRRRHLPGPGYDFDQ